jgi:hypothetical protein
VVANDNGYNRHVIADAALRRLLQNQLLGMGISTASSDKTRVVLPQKLHCSLPHVMVDIRPQESQL